MVSRVQAIAGQALGATAVTLVLPTTPTAGNLLVFVSYAAAATTQASASVTGFTQDSITDTASNFSAVVMSRLADGSEGTTHTLQWPGATTSLVTGELMELAPTSGRVWATSSRVAASGSATTTSATTATVTATAATTGPSYAVAVLGIGGTASFLNTWTGGFASDGSSVASGRQAVAVKDSASAETFSTTETWDTARVARMALAAYKLDDAPGLAAPTGLNGVATSPTTADITWNAVPGATNGYGVERDGVIIAAAFFGTTYHDTGLTPGATYLYRVGPVN